MKRIILLFSLSLLLVSGTFAQNIREYKLSYKQPAEQWSAEALPIGNGRMGAMFFGGIKQERIQFNEQSLWSGENNWDGKYETGDLGFGSYRNFGELALDFNLTGEPTAYLRSLDILSGIHTTSFTIEGIKYSRESFASYPDQVMVFNYTCTKKNALSGKVSLTSAQGAVAVANENSLTFSGEMPNKLKYAAKVRIISQGGTTRVEGNCLVFEKCNSFTLLVIARTNYKPDYVSGWRGSDPATPPPESLTLTH